jgi:hypothetical protein
MVEDADGIVRLDDAADVSNFGRWNSIFKAAGLSVPRGADPAEHVERLVGREVEVLVRNLRVARGKNAGLERAVVASWLPPTP